MGAPFTQEEIQAEIDNCKDQLRTAMASQQYSYDQGPIGQFTVEKGDVAKIKNTMKFWIDTMDEYYPSAFAPAETSVKLYEIGYTDG